MTKVIEKTVYSFDELSDQAKEKAREWFREGNNEDWFWSESVIEDAAQCGEILGIDLCTRAVKLMGGGTRMEPCVYWSGFWSQGDGACFEGNYKYVKGASKKIREHAPRDTELHRIADELQAVQRKVFYCATASTRQRGHYQHSGCMEVEVSYANPDKTPRDWEPVSDAVTQLLRDFADWIYRQLEKEWEWQNADEQVDETIRANDYEFDVDGGKLLWRLRQAP